jgi:hypothetical protein
MVEAALLAISGISLFLYGRELYLKKKKPDTSPIDPNTSYQILEDAVHKSKQIMSEAELEGSKIASDVKFYAKKLEHEYESELKAKNSI